MKKTPLLVIASALACGVACSSDPETEAPSTPSSHTVSVPISAAAGGTLQAAGATLTLPPGALATDATITAKPLDATAQPDAANIVSKVYDFGPSGTTFQKPVTLTFDLTGTAPADKLPKIAFLEDGAWQTLDSTVAGTKVEAEIRHFTPYTVVVTAAAQQPDGGAGDAGDTKDGDTEPGDTDPGDTDPGDAEGGNGGGEQPALECAKDFEPCGGELAGTWKIAAGCGDIPSGLKDGACQSTATSTKLTNIASTATVTFNADMTYTMQQQYDIIYTYLEPSSCYAGSCPTDTTDNGDGTCTKTRLQSVFNTDMRSYKTGTKSFTLQDGRVVDYCVQGNTLYWAARGAASSTYYTLTKQ